MSVGSETAARPALGLFERWLTLWVFLCVVAGIALGQVFPAFFQMVAGLEIAHVNIAVGVLIEVPVMLSVVKIVNATKGWYVIGEHCESSFMRP